MSVLLTYEQKDAQAKIPGDDSDGEDPDGDPLFGSTHLLSTNGYDYNQHETAMEVDGEGMLLSPPVQPLNPSTLRTL